MIDFTKKISFIIENENEWIRCQKFLSERGFEWYFDKKVNKFYDNTKKSIDINIHFDKRMSFSAKDVYNSSMFDNIVHFNNLDRKQKLNKILHK